MMTRAQTTTRAFPQRSALAAHVVKHRYLYLLLLPGLIFYILFKYLPMYGVIIAFKQFTPDQRNPGQPLDRVGELPAAGDGA